MQWGGAHNKKMYAHQSVEMHEKAAIARGLYSSFVA